MLHITNIEAVNYHCVTQRRQGNLENQALNGEIGFSYGSGYQEYRVEACVTME